MQFESHPQSLYKKSKSENIRTAGDSFSEHSETSLSSVKACRSEKSARERVILATTRGRR